MTNTTLLTSYETSPEMDGTSRHGLLATAYETAQQGGLFEVIGDRVQLRMRTKDYSWVDKLKTLWASIIIGCDHTKDINAELGTHEPQLAELFGLSKKRFPDQSGVNRLLHRFTGEHVAQLRSAAFEL